MNLRLCFACRTKIDRTQLTRILQDYKTGEYFINPNEYRFGRSVYLCKNETCVTKFLKHKKFKDKFKKEELNAQ